MAETETAPKKGGILGAAALLSFSRIWAQAANLILLLIAARVLSIQEFGAFSLVSITILIMHQTAETGWYEYASNTRKTQDPPAELFWCTLLVGVAALLISAMIALGLFIATGSEKYALLMLMLSPMPFMGAFASLQYGVHTQRDRVIRIPLSNMPGEALGLVVGIWALLSGYGVYALAMHKLVTLGLTTLLVSGWGGWFAPYSFQIQEVRKIFAFTWQLLLSRLAGFMQSYGGDYLVALLLSLEGVGLYRAGTRIAGSVAEVISETARIIGWARLSSAAEDTPQGRRSPQALTDLIVLLLLVSVPSFYGLAYLSTEIVQLLLGEKWAPAGPVILFLSLAKVVVVLIPVMQPVMVIAGQEEKLPRLLMFIAIATLVCLAALASFGATWAAASQLIASFLIVPVILGVFFKQGGLDARRLALDFVKINIAALGMIAAIFSAEHLEIVPQDPLGLMIFVQIAIGTVAFGLVTLVVKPSPAGPMIEKILVKLLKR